MRWMICLALTACSAMPTEGPIEPSASAPAVGFPDLAQWGEALATVEDPEQKTTRTIYRSPDRQVWAKVHHPLGQRAVITRIDVRRRAADGWRYESWDPARRIRARVDVETCQLCHSMAPKDGTYTR